MSEFVTEGYYRQICTQQATMAEQAKRIQVLGDALEYIINFGFCAPEDLVAHCKSALKVPERMSTVDKELSDADSEAA